ncbi:winged helix-turn-helix domain-containing protein [Shewanella yunxiaonensis]|uniref:Winged helix-turn-helix domain-containing protein n=1 Tax=Shewanella yunxiaonensis TaxID=2829809 RepID=A0ABX7YS95_9GAMM|nr:winged helix-turn-helix domain-containing protein [Shewanella yunxiaonensis]QUN05209.1 winged helix-turn-helix domain-containing protein [Shewanella yunxiaonensis]
MQLGNYWYSAQLGELQALVGDVHKRLSVAERRILAELIQQRDKVVSRFQLLQILGHPNEQLLDRSIQRLQQKLDDVRGVLLQKVASEGFILHQHVKTQLRASWFGGLPISWNHYCTIILVTLLAVTMLWHQLPVQLPLWWPQTSALWLYSGTELQDAMLPLFAHSDHQCHLLSALNQ